MVDGIYNQSYRLPHFLVDTIDTPLPVPVYFMRSVGSTAAVFFWESFISELAQRAKASINMPTGAICWPMIRWRCVCSTRRRMRPAGRRGLRPARSGASLTIAISAGRAVQNLRRGSRGAQARRRTVRDQAHLLRRRSGPGGEPEHAEGADRGRDRILALTNTLKSRDHLLQRWRRPVELLRLQSARAWTRCRRSCRSSCRAIARRRGSARWSWRRSRPRSRRPCCTPPAGGIDVMPFPDGAFQVAAADTNARGQAQ